MNFQTMNRKALGLFLPLLISIFVLGGIFGCSPTNAAVISDQSGYDPGTERFLDSWNDSDPGTGTGSKEEIIAFVQQVVDQVPVEDRIAVFDNDGTLWSEKPKYFPIQFIEDEGPSINMTTEDYIQKASDFVYGVDGQIQEDFEVPYRELVYKPVIGLVDYLKANGFKVYICSGGDIDFVRSFSDEAYGIPPEQVIGTAVLTEFNADSKNVVRKKGILRPAQYNDQEGKPVGIQNHIGKRPIIAVGNSGGDFEMFQYTDTEDGNALIVLINHDDCQREYKYNDEPDSICQARDPDHPFGDLIDVPCNESLKYAEDHPGENWIVVSMQRDFGTIFEPEPERTPAPVCN